MGNICPMQIKMKKLKGIKRRGNVYFLDRIMRKKQKLKAKFQYKYFFAKMHNFPNRCYPSTNQKNQELLELSKSMAHMKCYLQIQK